jgi:hypothetical protein
MSNKEGHMKISANRLVSGLAFALVFAIMLAGAVFSSGCKSSETVAARVAVSYATAKLIEKQTGVEERAAQAREILAVLDKVEELAQSDSTSIDALRAYVAQRLDHLSPADRMLAGVLIDVAYEALKEKVGTGVIDPEKLVKIREVLAWVREGAIGYVPTVPQT